jgi:hypothetical protein
MKRGFAVIFIVEKDFREYWKNYKSNVWGESN